MVLVNKPAGMTSHQMVAKLRRDLGTRKIGHAGTLDPSATGVLLLGVGRGTKLLTYCVGLDKTYTATLRLGATTRTDDADSPPENRASQESIAAVTDAHIYAQAEAMTGSIDQVPSQVSAVKVDGKRAYARVRAGEDVKLSSRKVQIYAFDINHIDRAADHIDLQVRVSCSTGTYIRALARDLGHALGIGGHVHTLCRTRLGPWKLESADTMLSLYEVATAVAASIPVTDDEAVRLWQGQIIHTSASLTPATDNSREARSKGIVGAQQPGLAGHIAAVHGATVIGMVEKLPQSVAKHAQSAAYKMVTGISRGEE